MVVTETADGIHALEVAENTHPDAIVLDLSMPGRDGLEVLPDLRRLLPDARIVVFSGFEASRLADTARTLGADAYLEKGCKLSEVVDALTGGQEPDAAAGRHDEMRGRGGPVRPHDALDVLVSVYERERSAVAGYLHDGPIQLLTTASLRLRIAEMQGGAAPALLAETAAEIENAGQELRALMSQTVSWELMGTTLEQALERLTTRAAHETGSEPTIELDPLDELPPKQAACCFRVVQEALRNVVRHANASSVAVRALRGDREIVVEVEDDGVGFDPDTAEVEGHLGLALMRTRVEAIGGRLDLLRTSRGTLVRATLPRTGAEPARG
jgi:signal transduction histidine kinase